MSNNGEKLVLGVDGGGTSTVAIAALSAADGDLEFIARGFGGPANPHSVGWDAALSNIARAIGDAARVVGVKKFEAGCFSIAGCGRADDQARLMEWLEKRAIAETTVAVDDGQAVLRAGSSTGYGLAVIAGTGSLVTGRNAAGQTARGGGWGFLLGDEGSAFAIGLEGLKAVTRAADGAGPPTTLTDHIVGCCELSSPADLVRWVYDGGIDRADIASLAPLVLEAAERRDEVALAIMFGQIHALERTVSTVAARLELEDDFDLALAGGVLVHSDLFRTHLLAELQIGEDRCSVVEEPAQGAALIAADLAH